MGIVGIVPAAGQASRMQGLPKFLLPVPEGHLLGLVCQRLLAIDTHPLYVAANTHNRNLLVRHAPVEARVYLSQAPTMAGTILRVQHWTRSDDICVLGMPDTYFSDQQAFHKVVSAVMAGATVAVGIWQTRPEQRHKLGMCRIEQGRLVELIDKPQETTDLTWAWGILAWRPAFWSLIRPEMAHMGTALLLALQMNMVVQGIPMDGPYWDCGTSEEYWKLCQTFNSG